MDCEISKFGLIVVDLTNKCNDEGIKMTTNIKQKEADFTFRIHRVIKSTTKYKCVYELNQKVLIIVQKMLKIS